MAVAITPEAILIPRTNPMLRDRPTTPNTVTANAATALEVYNEDLEIKCSKIWIQNLSTTPLKCAFNTVCGENAFHEVMAACQAQDDGLGGALELDITERGIKSISLYCGGAAIRASVIKYNRNEVKMLI